MIDAGFAAKQIERMGCLREFPKGSEDVDKAARRELLRALQQAESEAQAASVIDEFIHWGNGFSPAPSEIRKAIYSSRTTPDPVEHIEPKNGYSCGFVCEGWGTVGTRPNVTWCTCEHANWLRREIPNWLELCNQEPGKNKPLIPRSMQGLKDTLASGSVYEPQKPQQAQADETQSTPDNSRQKEPANA